MEKGGVGERRKNGKECDGEGKAGEGEAVAKDYITIATAT